MPAGAHVANTNPPISQARLGAGSGDPEGLSLVQRRIGQYAALVGSVSLAFYAVGALHTQASSVRAALVGPGRVEHLVGTLLAFGVALRALRGRGMGLGELGRLDAIGLIAPAFAWAAMVLGFGTMPGTPSGWLAVSFAVIGRAIAVPSTVLRTVVISAVAVAPQPVVAWIVAADRLPIDPSAYSQSELATESALWSLAAVAIATYASQVIYGLREQVREARRLGQYILVKKLGEGGMGEVFLAQHALLRRPTAIKLIRPGGDSAERLRRFEREVQRTAELTNPHTVQVYDYGHTSDGIFYYAMEYLDGVDLERLVRAEGALPAGRVLHFLDQVCASLAEAHDKGLVHRDIKPANLIVSTRGGAHDTLKVVDFGLVKDTSEAGQTRTKATRGDRVVGTPHYIAPEAITAPAEVDGRSDLYALGAVGYFLATGREVFEGKTLVAVLSKHLHEAPAPMRTAGGDPVAADLEAVVLACLAKSATERPPSASALRTRLRACHDFGSWSEEDARAWWSERGPTILGDRATASVSEDSRTLGIDLLDRAAPELGMARPRPARREAR